MTNWERFTSTSLIQYVETTRAAFLRAGYDVSKIDVHINKTEHDSPRHFGSCDGSNIYLAPELARMPSDIIEGVIYHEFGHVIAGTSSNIDNDERRADKVASIVKGKTLRYTGPHFLQSFERGISPRPKGLR